MELFALPKRALDVSFGAGRFSRPLFPTSFSGAFVMALEALGVVRARRALLALLSLFAKLRQKNEKVK